MKKYITIAALLAAGTAFANAEESVDSLSDAKFSIKNPTTGTYTLGDTFSSTSFSFTFTLAPDVVNVIGESVETSEAMEIKPTLLSVTAGASHYVGAGVGYSSNGETKLITGAGIWGQATQASSSTSCGTYFGGSNIDNLDDVKTIAVTVTHEVNSGTTFYISALSNDGTWAEYTPAKNTSLKWSSGNAAPSALDLNTNAGISSVYIFDSTILSASGAQAINHAAVAALPEPSAFGMLAGLGALALVASRRRRK
ncbi:MAG: PEP-CTERM sorting domain-containing protein [Opitutales bacterium]|nr:PEP-CTERM sorting domain-containing protein [Opitutales bacterium]